MDKGRVSSQGTRHVILSQLCKKFITEHHIFAVNFHVPLNPLKAFTGNFNSTTQWDNRWSCLSTSSSPGVIENCGIFWSLGTLWSLCTDGAEPLLVLGVLLLCEDPPVEQRPGVNGKGVLLIHAAVKESQQSFCRAWTFEHKRKWSL